MTSRRLIQQQPQRQMRHGNRLQGIIRIQVHQPRDNHLLYIMPIIVQVHQLLGNRRLVIILPVVA